MTDRNSMLIVILGTTLWFVIRVGLHWYFGAVSNDFAANRFRASGREVAEWQQCRHKSRESTAVSVLKNYKLTDTACRRLRVNKLNVIAATLECRQRSPILW